MDKFDQAVKYLQHLGFEYRQDYEYRGPVGEGRRKYDVKVFIGFFLPFSAEEWCSLCMNKGDYYMGGCCGQLSAVQDVLDGVFREGGWISGKDLIEIADGMSNHDEHPGEYNFVQLDKPISVIVEQAKLDWIKLGPWDKIALLWHIVKDCVAPDKPFAPAAYKEDPINTAIFILSKGMRHLSFEKTFTDDKKLTSQQKANRALLLAKLIPALQVVYHEIQKLDLGVVDGFAIIDKEKGHDAVAQNGHGYCIYSKREDVDHIFDLWRQEESEYEERNKVSIDAQFGVRPVRVTMEHGLEFTDFTGQVPSK